MGTQVKQEKIAQVAPDPIPLHPNSDGVVVCPQCKAHCLKGAKFCSKCGTALPGTQTSSLTCPRCDAPGVGDDLYCTEHGVKLIDPSIPWQDRVSEVRLWELEKDLMCYTEEKDALFSVEDDIVLLEEEYRSLLLTQYAVKELMHCHAIWDELAATPDIHPLSFLIGDEPEKLPPSCITPLLVFVQSRAVKIMPILEQELYALITSRKVLFAHAMKHGYMDEEGYLCEQAQRYFNKKWHLTSDVPIKVTPFSIQFIQALQYGAYEQMFGHQKLDNLHHLARTFDTDARSLEVRWQALKATTPTLHCGKCWGRKVTGYNGYEYNISCKACSRGVLHLASRPAPLPPPFIESTLVADEERDKIAETPTQPLPVVKASREVSQWLHR